MTALHFPQRARGALSNATHLLRMLLDCRQFEALRFDPALQALLAVAGSLLPLALPGAGVVWESCRRPLRAIFKKGMQTDFKQALDSQISSLHFGGNFAIC